VFSGDIFTALVGGPAGAGGGPLVSDSTRGETDGAALQAANAAARAALASALLNSVEVSEGATDIDPDLLFQEAWSRCAGPIEETLAEVLEIDLDAQPRAGPAGAADDSIRAALADASQRLEQEKQASSALKSQLAELQGDAEGASDVLRRELDEAASRVASVEGEYEALKETYEEARAELQALTERGLEAAEARDGEAATSELEDTVATLEARLGALASEVEAKDERIEALLQGDEAGSSRGPEEEKSPGPNSEAEARVEVLQQELAELQARSTEAVEAQAKKASEDLESAQRDLEVSKEGLAQMEAVCEALTASVAEAKDEVEQSASAGREERSKSQRLIKVLSEKVKSLEARLEAQEERQAGQSDAGALAEALALKEDEASHLVQGQEELLSELEVLRSSEAGMKESFEVLEGTSKAYQDDIKDLQEQLGRAEEGRQQETADHEAAQERLHADLESLKVANSELSGMEAEAASREDGYKRELASLQVAAEELNGALATAAAREGAMAQELEEKGGRLDAALKDLEALQVATEDIEARSTSALCELEQERDALQLELNALGEQQQHSAVEVLAEVEALETKYNSAVEENTALEAAVAETERVWRARCGDIEGQMEKLIGDMRVKTDSREDMFSQEREAWKQRIQKLEERLVSVQRMVEVKNKEYRQGSFRPAEDPEAHVLERSPDLGSKVAQLEGEGKAAEAQTIWTQAALETLIMDIKDSLGEGT
jgi:chromosome segregation ATPase